MWAPTYKDLDFILIQLHKSLWWFGFFKLFTQCVSLLALLLSQHRESSVISSPINVLVNQIQGLVFTYSLWFPSHLLCFPQEISAELPGSEFVLEYANPDLRFSILCDSRALLQGFILRMLLLTGYKVDEVREVFCCLLLDEKQVLSSFWDFLAKLPLSEQRVQLYYKVLIMCFLQETLQTFLILCKIPV